MMLIVWVLSHHYFRADIVEWEFTTVVTAKTLVFDVEEMEVRIEGKSIMILWQLFDVEQFPKGKLYLSLSGNHSRVEVQAGNNLNCSQLKLFPASVSICV